MNPLKQLRLSKSMTQENLARRMDITLSYYSQVERGVLSPSSMFMWKLKRAFPEINIDEMFFSDEVFFSEVKEA